MSEPMLSAARQFGGQYAEQQKEKVLPFPLGPGKIASSDREILVHLSIEVLFRRGQRVRREEDRVVVVSVSASGEC